MDIFFLFAAIVFMTVALRKKYKGETIEAIWYLLIALILKQ